MTILGVPILAVLAMLVIALVWGGIVYLALRAGDEIRMTTSAEPDDEDA